VIPRRFKLVFALLLMSSGSHSLLAATQPGGYTPVSEKAIYFLKEQVPSSSVKAATAGSRLQLAATLGENVPRQLEEAWQKNPENVDVGLILLRYYLEQQDNARTLALAKQLYALQPSNPQVLKALTLSLLATGDPNTALNHAEKLTELLPHSPSSWYLLGLVYSKKPDNAQAHLALDRTLALQPENLAALELKARLCIGEKKFKEALEIAHSIRVSFPAKPIGYQYEGEIYKQQRNFAKAAIAFQIAFNKAPSTELELALADTQWQAGNQTDAVKMLQSWLATHPNDTQVRTQLLIYLSSLQRYPEAIAEGETILKQEPDNATALNNLAALYQQVGDKRALEVAERAMQQAPDSPDVADTLGWILVQSNQLQRGIELLRQAMLQRSDDPQIGYHLAAAYAKAGQRETALQQLSIVLQLANLSPTKLPANLLEDVKKLQESLQQE